MTDKEKKSKIADILLEFYDEYQSNEINRPMIPNIYAGKILDFLQEEPTIPDIVDEHWWEMLGEEHVSNKMGGINNALSQDILAIKSVDEAMAEVEEKAKAFTEAHKGESSEQLLAQMRGEDPVSEDLEKEVYEHLWKGRMGADVSKPIYFSYDELLEVARHFAAWQKEQDKQWHAENHKHIFAKGRESAEVWISADDDVNNAAEKTTRRFCKISLLSGDYLSLAEAQPQVNKESKLIAIKSFVCGAQWDRNKLMKEAVDGKVTGIGPNVNGEVYDKSQKRISATYTADNVPYCELGDKVKLIILKEE